MAEVIGDFQLSTLSRHAPAWGGSGAQGGGRRRGWVTPLSLLMHVCMLHFRRAALLSAATETRGGALEALLAKIFWRAALTSAALETRGSALEALVARRPAELVKTGSARSFVAPSHAARPTSSGARARCARASISALEPSS